MPLAVHPSAFRLTLKEAFFEVLNLPLIVPFKPGVYSDFLGLIVNLPLLLGRTGQVGWELQRALSSSDFAFEGGYVGKRQILFGGGLVVGPVLYLGLSDASRDQDRGCPDGKQRVQGGANAGAPYSISHELFPSLEFGVHHIAVSWACPTTCGRTESRFGPGSRCSLTR